MLQRQFRLDPKLFQGMLVKRAETLQEFEGAFRLLHDNYVQSGFSTPRPSGLRLIPHHLLPSTSVLIVRQDEQVIGTVTLVRDCPLGLPMEKVWDLSRYRSHGTRLAEITCLAVDPSCRRSARILFPLLKYIYEYAWRFFGVDMFAIVIHPKDIPFYENLLSFNKVPAPVVPDYLGAPAIAMHLDLRGARLAGEIGRYFSDMKLEEFIWPSREKPFLLDGPAMPAEIVRHFARLEPQMLRDLGQGRLDRFLAPFPGHRRATRFPVELAVEVAGEHGIVKNLSRFGLRLAKAPTDAAAGDPLEIRVLIPDESPLAVRGTLAWSSPKRGAGIRIESQEDWIRFVALIEKEFPSAADVMSALESGAA
ncbi:MAG: hypothetical protein HUU37_09235 [Bdellovibrionales bacterium]|nr:hypothetical protein [Bdellovibrionales bacterium]